MKVALWKRTLLAGALSVITLWPVATYAAPAESLGPTGAGDALHQFFGPGGGLEQGARKVLSVNEEGSRKFGPGGTTRLEVLHHGSDGDLGYWTGLQHATVVAGPHRESIEMTLRVTEVFRKEDGAWKLVHRHADRQADPAGNGG